MDVKFAASLSLCEVFSLDTCSCTPDYNHVNVTEMIKHSISNQMFLGTSLFTQATRLAHENLKSRRQVFCPHQTHTNAHRFQSYLGATSCSQQRA